MVELLVWLLQTYHNKLDPAKEAVFAKVHFTLFYTAILNALQTVALAIGAYAIARGLWVQTESFTLSHYVELREAFDEVSQQLSKRRGPRRLHKPSNDSPEPANMSLFSYHSMYHVGEWSREVWESIRYPLLTARYNRLLVQVRLWYAFGQVRLVYR
jgi:hypothetical protein